MPAPRVRSDYDLLSQIARTFGAQSDNTQKSVQSIRRQMDTLKNGDWVGKGATQFYQEMEQNVLPALTRLVNALRQAGQITAQISALMKGAENDAASCFRINAGAGGPVVGAAGGPEVASAPTPGSGSGGSSNGGAALGPRVYILNGINSKGGFYLPNGQFVPSDEGSYNLQERLRAAGYDARAMPAVYNTNIQGTNLQGTNFGGWLKPVDWLTGAGASAINKITGIGAPVVNTLVGVNQVATEYLMGENGPYTQQTYDWIKQDLEKNPLAPGQTIVLAGHSGAGAPLANLTGMIENRLGHDVSGLVTMGSPISNYDYASQYAETIVDARHGQDLIGMPYFRSDEAKWVLAGNPLSNGIEGVVSDQLFRDNWTNVHREEFGNVGFFDKLKFWTTGDGHSQSWQSPEVVGMFEKYFPIGQ